MKTNSLFLPLFCAATIATTALFCIQSSAQTAPAAPAPSATQPAGISSPQVVPWRDPTQAGTELQRLMQGTQAAGGAALPQVIRLGYVSVAGNPPQALIEIPGAGTFFVHEGSVISVVIGPQGNAVSRVMRVQHLSADAMEIVNEPPLTATAATSAATPAPSQNSASSSISATIPSSPPATVPAAAPGTSASQADWPQGDIVLQRVEFADVPLVDAMRLISSQTGLNIVCSAQASPTKVSLFLQKVAAHTAIEELCKAHNLAYRFDDNDGVVRITTVDEFQKNLTNFRDQETQVFTLLYPNPAVVATAIADLYGDRVKLSLGDENSDDELQDLQNRFSRFDLIDQRSQGFGTTSGTLGTSANGGLGTGSLGGSSTGGGGGGQGYYQTRTQETGNPASNEPQLTSEQASRVQNAPPSEREKIIDQYHRQQASIYITVIRRENDIVVRTSDQETMKEIAKLIQRLDVPTPLIMLEVKVLSINLGDSFNSAFDFEFSNGHGVAGGFTSGDIMPPLSDTATGASHAFTSMLPTGSGIQSNDLIFQVVSNSFRARLQALESKNRVTQLAAPLLLTANNEVSRLFVGEDYPIVQNITSQTVVNNNTTTTSPNTTINFEPVGTTLLLTPNINADRTVTLRLLQDNSQVVTGGATIPIVTGTGAVQSEPIDIVSSQLFSGTVVAKDSQMLAIGGLISEQVSDQRDEVPILGKLPVVGILFRRQTTERTRSELVILIRPYILNTPSESAAVSGKLISELSIHPMANHFDGTLNTFLPNEVPHANPATQPSQRIFRFHSVYTGDY